MAAAKCPAALTAPKSAAIYLRLYVDIDLVLHTTPSSERVRSFNFERKLQATVPGSEEKILVRRFAIQAESHAGLCVFRRSLPRRSSRLTRTTGRSSTNALLRKVDKITTKNVAKTGRTHVPVFDLLNSFPRATLKQLFCSTTEALFRSFYNPDGVIQTRFDASRADHTARVRVAVNFLRTAAKAKQQEPHVDITTLGRSCQLLVYVSPWQRPISTLFADNYSAMQHEMEVTSARKLVSPHNRLPATERTAAFMDLGAVHCGAANDSGKEKVLLCLIFVPGDLEKHEWENFRADMNWQADLEPGALDLAVNVFQQLRSEE
jgi:hypothetical protein